MRNTLLLWLICLCTLPLSSQIDNKWVGIWSGPLKIFKEDTLVMDAEMRLEIKSHSLDTFTWKITYSLPNKQDERDYLIINKDHNKGHCLIDERNGIMIDAFINDGKLISAFEVQNSVVVCSYHLEPDHNILFEIIFYSNEPMSHSGGENDIPEVISYPVGTYQRALLQRM